MKISIPNTQQQFEYGLDLFASQLKREDPHGVWDAPQLWELYAADFGSCASASQRLLSNAQFFRRLGAVGIRRYRAGAKDHRGKRPYFYRLASTQRPRRRPGRIIDAVHAPSTVVDDWVAPEPTTQRLRLSP